MGPFDAERKTMEILAEEFVARYRRGERPALTEYVNAHPELAAEIRELFPTLVMMEELAPSDSDSVAVPSIPIAPPPRLALGDYRILREIGRGGMGIVYEAEQLSLGRRVALKVLRQATGDASTRQRFHREARAAAQLHHTNIVPVFEVGEDQDACWYAMQLIHGQGLDQIIEELRPLRSPAASRTRAFSEHQLLSQVTLSLVNGQFACVDLNPSTPTPTPRHPNPPPQGGREKEGSPSPLVGEGWGGGEQAFLDATDSGPQASRSELSAGDSSGSQYYRSVARIGRQAAEALAHAHARGIIHRDIKPSNLLLDTCGILWITDFGLAKTQDSALTTTGDIVGTVRYMAPERLKGEGDERADVYALGLTLYELLVLRPAFAARDRLELIDHIKNQEPPRPRSLDKRIPRDLETILLKATHKEARRRYQKAEALAEDLRRFLANEPIQARRTSQMERLRLWSRRNPALAALLLVLVLVAAGASAAAFYLGTAEQRALQAERKSRLREADALVGQAHGTRLSRRPGQRFEALDALGKAAAIGFEVRMPPKWFDRLRNEAIAALALPDICITQQFDGFPPGTLCVALSDDFELYARLNDKGLCTIHRVADNVEITRLTEPAEPGGVRFGPGRLLTVYGASGRFQLWDLSGAPVLRLQENGFAAGFFRADGRLLALPHMKDSSIHVYDTSTGQSSYRLAGKEITRDLRLALHPSEPFVACFSYLQHPVLVRDLRSGAVVARVNPPWSGGSGGCAWSPDGCTLAVPCGNGGLIQLYAFEAATPALRPLRTVQGPKEGGLWLSYNPTGDRFVVRGWDGVVHLVDAISGQLLFSTHSRTQANHGYPRFDRAGQRLAAVRVGSRQEHVGLFSVADAREYRTLVHAGRASTRGDPAIHPGGRLATIGLEDGVAIFDLETGAELAHLPIHSPRGTMVCFDGTGNLLTNDFAGLFRWPVRPDPVNRDRLIVGPPERLRFHEGDERISASRDGRVIAQCMWAGSGMERYTGGWILHPNAPTPRWVHASLSVRHCSVSPDGRWAAFGWDPLDVYDTATGQRVWQAPASARTMYCRFSPDGRWLATDGDNGRLYAAGTWEPGPQLGPGTPWDISPDGTLAVLGQTDGIYRLVELATGRELARLEDPEQNTGAAAFTPDGAKLVVAAKNGLRVWELRRLRAELAKRGLDWDSPSLPPAEHSANPLPLHITSDMGWMAPHESPQQAIIKYSLALAVMPANLAAYGRRGHASYRLGQWRQAADDLGLVLALHPANEDIQAWSELGNACFRCGRLKEALAAFSRLIQLGAADTEVYNERSVAAYCLGLWDQAIADVSKALQLQPEDPTVKNNLAWILAICPKANLRDPARSVELAQQVVAKLPREGGYWTTLGVAHYRAGEWTAARQALEKALEVGQGSANIFWFGRTRWFLAMSYWQLGEKEKARTLCRQAVEWMEKNQAMLAKDQGRWNELRGFRSEAESTLAKPPEQVRK